MYSNKGENERGTKRKKKSAEDRSSKDEIERKKNYGAIETKRKKK